jgi:hypothetical protein
MKVEPTEIEALARAMLRQRIEQTPWFRMRMTAKQRQAAIQRDVDEHWRLFVPDAVRWVFERVAQEAQREVPGDRRAVPSGQHLQRPSIPIPSLPKGNCSDPVMA